MPESIQQLLDKAAKQLAAVSESARLDAEVLLGHCLEKNRSFLRAWPELPVNPTQNIRYKVLIAQRRQGFPVAYLTGRREFWSRDFIVSPDVLIPRPDSELLIELSLANLSQDKPCKIIDLGTGSGILAITLAAESPLAQVMATDISSKALNIAKHNADRLNSENVCFAISDWFEQITDQDFDLVISNPPYICEDDPHLQQGDVRFEPGSALISGENGLKDIRLIAEQSRHHLKNNGCLLIEHGYNQAIEVQAIFKALHYRNVNTHPDLSGQARVTSGLWTQL